MPGTYENIRRRITTIHINHGIGQLLRWNNLRVGNAAENKRRKVCCAAKYRTYSQYSWPLSAVYYSKTRGPIISAVKITSHDLFIQNTGIVARQDSGGSQFSAVIVVWQGIALPGDHECIYSNT